MKTKKQRVLENIAASKDLQKKMPAHMDNEDFYNNAVRYISAIKQGRIICNIESVSKSGMSRNIKFLECSGNVKNGFRYYNFYAFFLAMGLERVSNKDCFRVHGCGMNMIFATNYNIIHRLKNLGFITKKECDYLAQGTPHVF